MSLKTKYMSLMIITFFILFAINSTLGDTYGTVFCFGTMWGAIIIYIMINSMSDKGEEVKEEKAQRIKVPLITRKQIPSLNGGDK